MGRELSVEVGRLNIGRRVKVFQDDKAHGMSAKLVEAHDRYAVCLIDNSPKPDKYEWRHVRDWTSHNPNPLVLPPMKAVPKLAPMTVAPTPVPVAQKDPFAVFAGLSQEIPAAMKAIAEAEEEVDTATEMLQQAEARKRLAVQGLADIKAAVASAAALLDKM